VRRLVVVSLTVGLATYAGGADLKIIKTQKAKDIEVSLLGEGSHWKQGKNVVVLEFSKEKQPVDAGIVGLTTSMPMPGWARW
jgi:hypothetical protein